jgi:ATP-dependent Lhr-like helicase
LVERILDKEGHHLFFYPFEGRLVHEGLAALFAFRIARLGGITFSMAANDYGFELLSDEAAPLEAAIDAQLLSAENLGEEILASLNSVEMARRQFREVARIAGLVFQGFPGAGKTNKQLQTSSGLLYDVFARFDPANMLLHQSFKEVMDKQLERHRMARALTRLQNARLVVTEPPRPTPLGFPILVDRLRDSLTTETVTERIERMSQRLEAESVA